MEIEKLNELYRAVTSLPAKALKQVLMELPEHEYEFQREVRLPVTESFSGEMFNVNVKCVYLVEGREFIHVLVENDYGEESEWILDDMGIDSAYYLLNAIDDGVLSLCEPFHPIPQTLAVFGEDNVDELDRVLGHEVDDEVRDFIKTFAWHTKRKYFLTKAEEKAYMQGVDDAVGWHAASFIDNDGRFDTTSND